MDCSLLMNHAERTIIQTFFLFIAVFGGTGNVRSLFCLFRTQRNDNSSNRIQKSLVFSDCLVCLIGLPFAFYRMEDEELASNCNSEAFMVFINIIGTTTSSMTVLLLALDRYILLARRQAHQQWMKLTRLKVSIVLVWLFCIFGSSMRFFAKKPFLVFVVLVHLLTIVGLAIFYFLIYKALRQVKRNLKRHKDDQTSSAPSNSAPSTSAPSTSKTKPANKDIIKQYKDDQSTSSMPAISIPVTSFKATSVPSKLVPAFLKMKSVNKDIIKHRKDDESTSSIPPISIPATSFKATSVPSKLVPASLKTKSVNKDIIKQRKDDESTSSIPVIFIPANSVQATSVPSKLVPASLKTKLAYKDIIKQHKDDQSTSSIPAVSIPANSNQATSVPSILVPASSKTKPAKKYIIKRHKEDQSTSSIPTSSAKAISAPSFSKPANKNTVSQRKRQHLENRVTRKIMVIILVYYITFAPATIMLAAAALTTENLNTEFFRQAIIALMMSSSCLNPIVYVATDYRFRKQFFGLFWSKNTKRKPVRTTKRIKQGVEGYSESPV